MKKGFLIVLFGNAELLSALLIYCGDYDSIRRRIEEHYGVSARCLTSKREYTFVILMQAISLGGQKCVSAPCQLQNKEDSLD